MQLGKITTIHNVMKSVCDSMGGSFSQEQTYPASGSCYVSDQPAAPVRQPYSPPPVITVSPQIQTQVSPVISPVFQQQFQPSGSPMTAKTSAAPAVSAPLLPPSAYSTNPPTIAPAPVPAPVYTPTPQAAPVAVPSYTPPALDTSSSYPGPAYAGGQVPEQTTPEPAGQVSQTPVDNTGKYMLFGLIGLGILAIGGRRKPHAA